METIEIEKIINNVDTAYEVQKELINVLNFVENLSAENIYLHKEVQNLKNEINKLKGEQGKPNIRSNTHPNIDISSENERIKAEKSNTENYGYKLDSPTLEKLQERDIPKSILELLKKIKKVKFSTEEEFLKAVENIIGKAAIKKYKDKFLKHGFYIKRKGKSKIAQITIDRIEICPVDKSFLPEDAIFSGYNDKTVQDIIITSDNVKFRKEVYYSPSLKKTFSCKVPKGYEGEFGPGINTQIISMKYVSNMSEPKILETLHAFGVNISLTYISDYLTKEKSIGVFHKEKDELFKAGLECGDYHQIDDTSSRENGKNKYVQIICNPLFTAYFTTDKKDRLTIIDIFRFLKPRFYMFNNEAFELLEKMNVYYTTIKKLKNLISDNDVFNDEQMNELLDKLFPNPPKGKTTRKRIMEAAAIAFYHQETDIPIIETLICDDAPQFKLIVKNLGLCWIHDGRHYKRLIPIVESHKKELENFRQKFWEYYGKLFEYKKNPNPNFAKSLRLEFDKLFSTQTDYEQLNKRISKTKAKIRELLLVLEFPNIPLHNNTSENAARTEKRRQDVSLQTKSKAGTKVKDTMMSIVETCKKQMVNPYYYIKDRVSNTFEMLSLAKLIKIKNKIML
ncbi:MAG: hypothetical protein DRJ01_15450 [Bacteroidetes bacterium]|nr:MAG: hypothetical protein DRJ01_15450 [Bacteroidota bacterium]